jgi:hypothetical protein
MSQKQKQTQQQERQRTAVATRRHATKRERERRRQRQIMIVAGAAIGLSLLAVLGGVLYEQLWLPSRPVAQIGATTLTRGEYTTERRAQTASTIGQSLYLATFGEQFAQQFLGQIGQLDAEVPQFRTGPVDDAAVDQWLDRQTIAQRAASEFNIQASDAAIAQALVSDYGEAFGATSGVTPTVGTLPTLPPLDATATLSETGTVTDTAAAGTPAAETPAAGTPAATATLTGPTATPSPSPTPAPTETPVPTPEADVALARQDEVVNTMFERYTDEIARIDPLRRPQLTIEDFRAGLRHQFERQVLVDLVQQQLVPDETFTESTDPSAINVRHILVKVSAPTTDTAALDQAFAERQAEAQELLEQAQSGDFETLARERSEDFATRDAGGQLPGFDVTGKTASGTQIDPAIVAAVANLEPGQVAPEVVRTSFGWHVVQLVDRTFDTREDQLRQARTEAFDTWLNEQRAQVSVQRFPPVSPSPTAPPTGTPAPLPTQDLGAPPPPTEIPTPAPIAEPTPLPTPTP